MRSLKLTQPCLDKNDRQLEDDIFECIFLNEKFCILIKIWLKFVPNGPIDSNPALGWIAWQNKYIRIKVNLHKFFANWWNIREMNLDFWTQAISDNWDEYGQEETTTHHVLRCTGSGQNNCTSIGCNVEGGGVGGNQGPK